MATYTLEGYEMRRVPVTWTVDAKTARDAWAKAKYGEASDSEDGDPVLIDRVVDMDSATRD